MHIISRSIEEKVEEYYKTKFDEYEIRHIGKTKSINSDISNTLSESESKSGGKGDNYPDIQLLLEDNYSRRIPVMIEAKGGKNKLEKLDKNGQIVQETVFASDSKPYVKNPIKKVIRIIQLLLLMLQMGHYIMVEVNPLDWTKIYLEGFTMVKFTVEQKLQALNLLKEGYSTCSLAQVVGAGSHQTIDTWAAQYQHFGIQGLEIRHTPQNYSGYFKLQVLNWRKDNNETYQNTAIHFKISSPSLIYTWGKTSG